MACSMGSLYQMARPRASGISCYIRGACHHCSPTRAILMAEEPARGPGQEESHRRGLRFRRRDDHAVNLFREAKANLDDVSRVDRILLELGRFYDPLAGGAIVDMETRVKIVEALRAGRADEALSLLDERLALYTKFDAGPEGGEPKN